MTCKDCYHYDVCYFRINSEQTSTEGTKIINCSTFKDKSTVLELPCKVGDTVYGHNGINVTEYKVVGVTISKHIKSYMLENKGRNFFVSGFGEYAFLTREEAEAALKAMEVSE